MNWFDIVLAFIGGGGLAWYVALRKLPMENRKMNVDAAAVASKALIDILNATQAERENYSKRIDAMEAEQEAHRVARNAEIDELKVKIQSDLMETRNLRADYADAQKRIQKLEDMAIRQSEYIDVMKTAMQNANIPIPLNGELLESARRLRLSREEMQRLRGEKK
jgi:hypothetical protein